MQPKTTPEIIIEENNKTVTTISKEISYTECYIKGKMIYKCSPCVFETHSRTNMVIHQNTKKHIKRTRKHQDSQSDQRNNPQQTTTIAPVTETRLTSNKLAYETVNKNKPSIAKHLTCPYCTMPSRDTVDLLKHIDICPYKKKIDDENAMKRFELEKTIEIAKINAEKHG
jgi:hypothetical protein